MAHPLRLTIALALLCAVALPASASAAATTQKKTFTVDITAIQVVDWAQRDAAFPSRCNAWSKGEGTQTIGFSTRRPVRYSVLQVRRTRGLPAGMPRFTWLATGIGGAKFRATVDRKATWEDHAIPNTAECTPCGPRSEYGPCGEDVPPPQPSFRCGRRTLPFAQGVVAFQGRGESRGDDLLAALNDRLLVAVSASSQGAYENCPPEHDGSGRGLRFQVFPEELAIVGPKVSRLRTLGVGRRITLKEQVERGFVSDMGGERESRSCTDGIVAGYKECAITDVTVEIRRVR